jgi:hypothetical protein
LSAIPSGQALRKEFDMMDDVKWTRRPVWVACLIATGLAACGGGGGEGNAPTPPQPTAVTISGTAAAGLPLVGTVTVKDGTGATKTVPLDANGGYSVDVTGMVAPVMLRAQGNVGASSYVIHSASASVGASGTVNITPLTDLIVANAAGQIAATYFAGSSFASLTEAELTAESAALKAKLLPVLQAMKVDASIDLLRTPFTPLSSALDKALDVLRVTVDPATQVATITNLVNQIAIADNLTVKAGADGNTTPMSATGMGNAAEDLALIRKAVTDLLALFATGLPQPAQVLPLLSSNFLHQDTSRADFANGVAQASDLVGASVTALEILGIDYANNGGANPLARIRFNGRNKQGIDTGLEKNWKVIKESDGVWRVHGDQRVLSIEGHVHLVKSTGSTDCLASGIEFDIQDENSSNSATINYLMISGPGLPAGGVKYKRSTNGDAFTPVGGGNPFWWPMTDTCNGNFGSSGLSDAAIAAIPDNAAYTIAAFTIDGKSVSVGSSGTYTEQIPKRPLTRAELQTAAFPTIAAPTAAAFASYTGGSLTISGSGVDPSRSVWLYLGLTDGAGQVSSVESDLNPTLAGGFSASPTLTKPAAVSRREIRVASRDAFERTLMTTLVK